MWKCITGLCLLFQEQSVRRTRLTASAVCTERWATPSAACSKSTSASRRRPCRETITTSSCRREDHRHIQTRTMVTFTNSLIGAFFFPRRLLEQGNYSDVTFMVHGEMFKAHRCILSARSEYFAHMLETKWKGKSDITLKHPLVGAVSLHTNHFHCTDSRSAYFPFCATLKPIISQFRLSFDFFLRIVRCKHILVR